MSEEYERDTSGDILTRVVSDEFCQDYCDVTPEWAAARNVARNWRTQFIQLTREVGEVQPISPERAAELGVEGDFATGAYAFYAARASTNYESAPDTLETGHLLVIVPIAPPEAYMPDHYDDGYGAEPLAFVKAFRTALEWLNTSPIFFGFSPDEELPQKQQTAVTQKEGSHAEAPA